MEPIAVRQVARRWGAKTLMAASLGAILGLAGCGESDPEAERAAVAATVPILERLDAGDYDAVRTTASPFLKEQVSRDEWLAQVQALRNPLGAHESRAVGTTTYVNNPWG
ncbi:MAG: DUF4019 domain-containing protein, partial [Gammaproteobacteria bacterium]|nr:DUF4019 domain-containing protein [Gammaproteobacteria bacterium]